MKCVLCYMISKGAKSLGIPHDCKDAVTIVNGNATCDGHLSYLQFIQHSSLNRTFQAAWDEFMCDAGLSDDKYASARRYRDGRNPE